MDESLVDVRLVELEIVIGKNLKAFYEVGAALMEIRKDKLYRLTHSTFEGYCKDRWDMSKMHAYRLMDSTTTIENLKSNQLVTLPVNESQARPLTKIEPDQQGKVWQRAVETAPEGKVTARHVSKIVNETIISEKKTKRKKAKNRIDKDILMSSDFRTAFNELYDHVLLAMHDNWQSTSKEAIAISIKTITDIVND